MYLAFTVKSKSWSEYFYIKVRISYKLTSIHLWYCCLLVFKPQWLILFSRKSTFGETETLYIFIWQKLIKRKLGTCVMNKTSPFKMYHCGLTFIHIVVIYKQQKQGTRPSVTIKNVYYIYRTLITTCFDQYRSSSGSTE